MIDHIHDTVEGWCSVEQQSLYSQIISTLPQTGSHIVEIGTWKGKSTSYMAVEIANSKKNIRFDAIDTFKGSPEHATHPSIVNNLLFAEYHRHIQPVKQYINTIVSESNRAVKSYNDNSLDFVFIDGNHSYDNVYEDITLWIKKLKPGGIISGDDYDEKEFPNVVRAVRDALGNTVQVNGHVWVYQTPANNVDSKILTVGNPPKYSIKYSTDNKLNIKQSFNLNIDHAYIITLENNVTSQEHTKKCVESCNAVGMPFQLFFGYDGTDKQTIKTPSHLRNSDHMRWIKIMDPALSITEVACALSHLALWAHCITIDRPIVILEHDALMLKKFERLSMHNTLEYLGHKEELKHYYLEKTNSFDPELFSTSIDREPIVYPININYLFPHGLHAYALDPIMARRLFAMVMTDGLINPIDSTIRADQFSVVQTGIYAIQSEVTDRFSTITNPNEPAPGVTFFGRKYTFNLPGVTL
jgi:GR25 family glycosyltransferase involved in LPS biosynthesis/predicted O-methyltransferase YrrM